MTRDKRNESRFYGYTFDEGTHGWRKNVLVGSTVFHRPPALMGQRAERVTVIILRGVHAKPKRGRK